MKKNYLITVITILICSYSYSQKTILIDDAPNKYKRECATEMTEPLIDFSGSQRNTSNTTSETQYVFNVKVRYICDNVPLEEQELKALDLVGGLNFLFNQGNIFFKYKGYDSIDDCDLLNVGSPTEYEYIHEEYEQNNSETIDIFVTDDISGAYGQIWAGISYPSGTWGKVFALRKDVLPVFDSVTPTNSDFKGYTFAHEMGHYFGLYHPHQRWSYNDNGDLIYWSDSALGCNPIEENYDGSEWETLGDFIQDTNPDRVKQRYWSQGFSNYDSTTCTIDTTWYYDYTFCNTNAGIDFNLFDPSMDNIMAFYRDCRSNFTSGQYDFMRERIEYRLSYLSYLPYKVNTIESLYSPFESCNYNIAGNLIPTGCDVAEDNRYQKGFTYKFGPCNSNNPNEVFNVNEIPIGYNNFNSVVKILQISEDYIEQCHVSFAKASPIKKTIISLGETPFFLFRNYEEKIINSETKTLQDENLLLSELPAGFYIIKTYLDNGKTKTRLIGK